MSDTKILYDELIESLICLNYYPKISDIFPTYAEIDVDMLKDIAEIPDDDVFDTLEVIFLFAECGVSSEELSEIVSIVLPFLIKLRKIIVD